MKNATGAAASAASAAAPGFDTAFAHEKQVAVPAAAEAAAAFVSTSF